MTSTATLESGLPSTDYYAPDYKVEIEGLELDPETKGDVLDLKVVMDKDNLSSFDLTMNNWDDRRLEFKYSDSPAFSVGQRVTVSMGYADGLVPMVRGLITTLTPKFPESGSPTIGVSGVDAMFCLKNSKPGAGETKKWCLKTDWEIAKAVAKRNGLHTIPTKVEGERHDIVMQKNQDDAQFLMERARRIDFECYIATDPETGKDALHFVKPTDGRDAAATNIYRYEWGKTLMNFSLTLTVADQVSKITVRGWNPGTKETISYTAEAKELPLGEGDGETGPEAVKRCLGGTDRKQDVVIDAPVTSEEEAKKFAIARLTEVAYEFITGSGQVIGIPELRPGDNVELTNLGSRFSGRYYVKKVEHTLNDSGYTTRFDVRKPYQGATT